MLEVGRLSDAAHSLDACPAEPEGSSPPGHQEVHEPLHNWDAARDPCSDPRGEISRLAFYLDVVQTTLAALERETTDAWVTAAGA